MPVYRPSLICNFTLRFDPRLTLAPAPAPQSVKDMLENPPASPGSSSKQPLILRYEARTSTETNQASFVAARIPVSGTVELPGYRQAGKFSFKFAFKDLPIDPRVVAAARVDIHLGAVSAEDFRDGMRGGTDPLKPIPSVLRPVVPGAGVNTDNFRMAGIVDEWEVLHDEKGSVVSMMGRDVRAILLDTPINAGTEGVGSTVLSLLDTSRPINEVVAQLLSFNPMFVDFPVVANAQEWPEGVIPAPHAADLIPRHRKGAKGKTRGGRATAPSSNEGDNLKFWDLIVRLCYFVGAIPHIVGVSIVIRPSRSVFDQITGTVDPVRNPTPFWGGKVRGFDEDAKRDITPALKVRRLVYGRDTSSVAFQRKFGGYRRPKHVRAVSFDPDSEQSGAGKILVGIYPPEETKLTTKVAPNNSKSLSEVLTIPVPGITDLTRLTDIARSIYEEVGRGEMGGVCETNNLASFGGGNADPDLLRLNPGDPIEFLVDTRNVRSGSPLVSTLTDHMRVSFEEAVADIAKRLGDENLARVIVATARGQVAELQRFFRVQTVKYTWNNDKGVQIAFDFENYVMAALEDPLPVNEPATTVVSPTDTPTTPDNASPAPGKSLRTIRR
jgi:hypothetical protein